jgi:hypothetical protein
MSTTGGPLRLSAVCCRCVGTSGPDESPGTLPLLPLVATASVADAGAAPAKRSSSDCRAANTSVVPWCRGYHVEGLLQRKLESSSYIRINLSGRTWTTVSCCCCASVSPAAVGAGAAARESAAGCGVLAACCRAAAAGGCDSVATASTGGTGGCVAALPESTSGCWRSMSVMCSIWKFVMVTHELDHLLRRNCDAAAWHCDTTESMPRTELTPTPPRAERGLFTLECHSPGAAAAAGDAAALGARGRALQGGRKRLLARRRPLPPLTHRVQEVGACHAFTTQVLVNVKRTHSVSICLLMN